MTPMKRAALLVLALGVLGAGYLALWPVPIDPVAWEAPTDEGYVGPHAPNSRLAGTEIVSVGGREGPEDVAVGPDGAVVTGTRDGVILRFEAGESVARAWADTEGRPLGLAFGPDGRLYVADAVRGLLAIAPDGETEVLATEADGRPIRYANNVDVAADGTVYLSEASNRFGPGPPTPHGPDHYQASLWEIFEHGGTGRVIRWSPRTREATTIADGLAHANGVALTGDGSALLVAETGSYRILRIELGADGRFSEPIPVLSNLPGFPDNLTRGRDGRFWVALVSPRNRLVDRLAGRPFLRKVILRLPKALQPDAVPFTHVVALDEHGRVLEDLQDPAGAYPFPTSVAEGESFLYLGSVKTGALGRIAKAAAGL